MPTAHLVSVADLVLVVIVARRLMAEGEVATLLIHLVSAVAYRTQCVLAASTVAFAANFGQGQAQLVLLAAEEGVDQRAVDGAGTAYAVLQQLRAAAGRDAWTGGMQGLLEVVARVRLMVETAPEGALASELAAGRWTGARWDRSRTTAEVAKLIRADLAKASAGTTGPLRQAKFRVRKTGTFYVTIEVTSLAPYMGAVSPRHVEREVTRPGAPSLPWMSRQGAAVTRAVERIANAYSFRRGEERWISFSVGFDPELIEREKAEVRATIAKVQAA